MNTGAQLPSYAQINFELSHAFHIEGTKPLTVRIDVINLFVKRPIASLPIPLTYASLQSRVSYCCELFATRSLGPAGYEIKSC